MTVMRCPNCKGKILHKSGDGHSVRISGPLTIDEHGQAHAQCHWCKSDVSLPLTFAKAEPAPKQYFIRTTPTHKDS